MIHQEDRWCMVAKPSGVACHRSAMCRDKFTVARWARDHFGRQVHLVHRLDRAVSGCLLIAFDSEMTHTLQTAMTSGTGRKQYLAFTRGFYRWDDPITVDKPMKDSRRQLREARSVIRCLGRSFDPWCSLLLVEPETGRYHQVRRHTRDLSHPILRDAAHGDSKTNQHWRDTHGLQRTGLHCHRMQLEVPWGKIDITSPPPEDLVAIWREMPWWDAALAAFPALGDATASLWWPPRD